MSAICQLLLSDFDQTLKVGSWDHLEQMKIVTVTLFQVTFVLSEAIFSFFEHILGHMKPLLNTEQLKGLISDHEEKTSTILEQELRSSC